MLISILNKSYDFDFIGGILLMGPAVQVLGDPVDGSCYWRHPADGSCCTGVGGILLMGVGIVLSGVYIRCARPSARAIAAWIAATSLLYCFGEKDEL